VVSTGIELFLYVVKGNRSLNELIIVWVLTLGWPTQEIEREISTSEQFIMKIEKIKCG